MIAVHNTFEQLLNKLVADRKQQIQKRLYFNPITHEIRLDVTGNTRGCGCSECIARFHYAESKKYLHRLNRHIELLYDTLPNTDYYEERVKELEELVKQSKIKFHKLNEDIKKLQ